MAVPREFHASNAKRHTKTLSQVRDTILNHLGYPQQCVGEITPDEIEEFILDSLSFVSQFKPKILEKTYPVAGQQGKIIATGVFYPSNWVAGDPVPQPTVRGDVIGILNVEPAASTHGETFYNGLLTDEFAFSQSGLGLRLEGKGSALGQMHASFDNFLDFQIVYQNIQAGLSFRGREFAWKEDYNDSSAAYYANLSRASKLTITVALEHSLGNTYYLPDDDETVGTPVKAFEDSITGIILYFTQTYALAKAMKKIGMIRTKLQGGLGQFELNGDTMLQEANMLEERIVEEIKAAGDLYGTYNDQY